MEYPGLASDQINQLISTYGTRVSMGIYDSPHRDSLFAYAQEVLGVKAEGLTYWRDLKSVEGGEVSDRRAHAMPRVKVLFRPWNLGEAPQ